MAPGQASVVFAVQAVLQFIQRGLDNVRCTNKHAVDIKASFDRSIDTLKNLYNRGNYFQGHDYCLTENEAALADLVTACLNAAEDWKVHLELTENAKREPNGKENSISSPVLGSTRERALFKTRLHEFQYDLKEQTLPSLM